MRPRAASPLRAMLRRWRGALVGTGLLVAALLVIGLAQAAISVVGSNATSIFLVANSVSLARPSGVVANDVMVAAIVTSNTRTITPPAGWTQLHASNGTRSPGLVVFYKVAGSSEPASYSFALPFLAFDYATGGISAYRGIDTASPIAASAIQANAASTSSTAPSITPGVADSMLVAIWATPGAIPTVPASMTAAYSATGYDLIFNFVAVASAYQSVTGSGATGTRVATTSIGIESNAVLLALRPLPTGAISGTVYEDLNYGGGAGRNKLLSSGGSGRASARVELYTVSGTTATFAASTTTDGLGAYSFTGLAAGNYVVRVVSSSVSSSRSGYTSSLLPVLTYRAEGSSGSASDVTDHVGGFNPAATDAGNGAAASAFSTSTGVYSAGPTGTAQAHTPVTVGTTTVAGIDFGFNFSTVVNTNNSGAGSLRQVLTNADTLGGDAALAQSGRTSGIENVVFMIANGTSAAGLRSSYNYFTTSAGAYNVATIAPTSGLPTLANPVVIDAQAQPGWTAAPLVEINGAGAGNVHGIVFNGAGTVIRGLIVNRYARDALHTDAGAGHVIQGNWLGVNAAGTAASPNGLSCININSTAGGHTVGGTSATQRNVLSGSTTWAGITVGNGPGTQVVGNYIGTSASGNAAIGNGSYGVWLQSGGSVTVDRNVIAGSGQYGVYIQAGTATITNNLIGVGADGSTALANGSHGVLLTTGGNTVGGTSAGNTIANNGGDGVVVTGSVTGNLIRANAMYGNTGLGIDLADNGISANDGAKTTGQPNLLMDYPVFTSATLSGTSLTVAGYVGSAAGQATFASARVEVFISDASAGNGEGRSYLGFLTADASGNFSGTLTGVTGITKGVSRITGTATDGSSNTSEFGPNFLVPVTISGTVFEDPNYGGGAGRSLAASGGAGVAGARVELYDGNGVFVAATTTAAGGGYSYTGLAAGSYFVRVVGSTVLSTRSGSTAALLGVPTYRTEAGAGTAVAVTDEVGGTNPVKSDAAAGTTGTSLWTLCAAEYATCTYTGTRTVRYGANAGATSGWTTLVLSGGTACTNAVFGDPIVGTTKACYLLNADYQSVSTVNANGGDVGGVDFGFNFDTVVNTNDSGAGSMRQVITNANTLGGDASLAVSGRTAGIEHVIFMIPNGSSAAGLRSALNQFTAGAATITLASAGLPSLSAPLVIDGQRQPGWASTPVIVVDGNDVAANGLQVDAGAPGSTLSGLVLRNFTGHGILVSSGASGVTITGNHVGRLLAAGTAAAAGLGNSADGIRTLGSGTVIGGASAALRNVVAGNLGNGITIAAASAVVRGNYVGIDATGATALANAGYGIDVTAFGPSATIGGAAAGQGNVISGNGNAGVLFEIGSAGTVKGNLLGTNAAGTAVITGNGAAVWVAAAGVVVGGTEAGAGNTITGSNTAGLVVAGPTTNGVSILGNSIHGNAGLGIDLALDGVNANDGAKTANQPNLLMDSPVITAASYSGTTLTVTGYVGSAAGQSLFGGARVEVFVADITAAGYGQGKTYLGALTADASGNFSGTLTGVTGYTPGTTRITATATDAAGNTSEFGANFVIPMAITGTVFEDLNYGGGAGRAATAAGAAAVAGARVELYSAAGAFVSATTTGADGGYSFTGLSPGTFHVRVVSSTVLSSRSGATSALLPVLTWRADAGSGSAVAVTDGVGGTDPGIADAGSASAGAALNTGTYVFSAGLSGTAHAVSPVLLTTGAVGGVDFGFNFDTVTNTRDSGQGSLRQAITNANTLGGDASLAVSGRTAGVEHVIFMIPNGSSAAGLRSAYNAFGGGVASIAPASALPTVSGTLVLDAQTQPGWTLAPIVEINGSGAGGGPGLVLSAPNTVLRGFVVNRHGGDAVRCIGAAGIVIQGNYIGTNAAGTAAQANGLSGVYVNGGSVALGGTTPGTGNVISGNGYDGLYVDAGTVTVQGNTIGLNAAGTAAVSNGWDGIGLVGGTGHLVGGTATTARNVIAGNLGSGLYVNAAATVQGNYIGTNAAGTAARGNTRHGIYVSAAGATVGGTAAGAGNVVAASGFAGVELAASASGTVVQGNTIGLNAARTAALGNATGVVTSCTTGCAIGGSAAGAGNVIGGNVDRGIIVYAPSKGNALLGNSIYGNGGIGIDLGSDGASPNDGAKTTGAANLLMDTPVFTSASYAGTTLTVAGYVGSAAGQGTFASARVEIFVSDGSNPAGQGQTYLGALTADASGNFSGTITGLTGLGSGTVRITGTATDAAGNTSEFGPNVTLGAAVSGVVYEDTHYGGGAGRSRAASGGATVDGATVELYGATGVWMRSTTTAAGGAYSFTGLAPGTYYVRVVGGTVQSQRSGSTAALRGVLTWRADATSGSAVAVTNHVGGTNPALADAGAAASGAAFDTSTLAYTAGLAGTAQNVAPVTVAATDITGVDFGFNFDTVVNVNDSGEGSLRQVITNANTLGGDAALAQAGRTAGVEHVIFMIPNGTAGAGLRSGYNQFSGGVATITPTSALATISAPLVIDAQTQPGWSASPIIELRGSSAGAVSGLVLSGGGSTVRGLIVNRWGGDGIGITAGGSYTVQGNWLGLDATGTAGAGNGGSGLAVSSTGSGFQIGGTGAGQRNVMSANLAMGYAATAGSGHVLQGNYVGTDATGTAALGNALRGISIVSPVVSATVGGTAAGAGNLISGQAGYGLWLGGGSTTVQGNWIGLNAAGTGAIANGWGLFVTSTGHQIGGTTAAARNVISGNTNRGIWLDAGSNTVQGNYVGTNAAGTATVANGGLGIYLKSSGNLVGGSAAGAANLVSGNGGGGIGLFPGVSGNSILTNAVHGNGAIGIDLGLDGVTANDGAKTAGTANLSMDAPVFTSARATGTQLALAGYVGSAPGQSTFAGARVEIYASDNDPSGYGQGRTYLGALTADASGNFSGTLTMPVAALALGTRLTGTATDGAGNTSEFGPNYTGLIVDLVVNDNGDAADASAGDGLCATAAGVCTLRAAIAERNAWGVLATTPTIVFALPGCASAGAAACRIAPATALPSITQSVVLDATTQAGYSTTSYTPIVELDGSGAPAGTTGIVLAAANSTLRGLAINRWAGNGLAVSGSGNTIAGNRVGLASGSAAKAANGGAGIAVTGSGNTLGGATTADRNTVAGNTGAGISVAAGTTTIAGNVIGTDPAGGSGLGNGGAGIAVAAAGIGGIAVSGNTIANNGGAGVVLLGGTAQASLLGNAFSGNGGLGIDLGNDGVTPNTGATDASRPNQGMNHPVLTGAGVGTGTLTVYGYIGTGTGQAAFAGARVDFYKAAADPSGYGEGQVPLGTLTADAAGRFVGTFAVAGLYAGDAITATATDASGNTSEFGPNWTTTTLAALAPGSFNAFDTDAAPTALTGVIRTRVAGAAGNFAVIALDPAGSALHPGFSGTVSLSWLDARDDTGAASGSCRASWVSLGAAGSATFSTNARVTVSLAPPATSTRVMRLQMRYTSAAGTVTACSTDAFAALPASLVITGASDGDAATAGTARSLNNTSASGGVVHRAGRPFTLSAQALTATGAVMTGYDGTPALGLAGCVLPSGCTPGTLGSSATAAVAGQYVNATTSYSEVGAISVQLVDDTFAAIDAADTAAAARTVTSAAAGVGRFVPDSLQVAVTTPGQFATANGACLAAGQGATFFGQGHGWKTAPQVTVTARNAAGATTVLWTGSLMKLTGAAQAPDLQVSGAGAATLAKAFGAVAVTDLGSGQARLAASGTDRFMLETTAPQPSLVPGWAWSLAVTDASEAAVAGNPTLAATASQAGVTFDLGGTFHSGRLALSPAFGDARSGVRALVHLQRWTAAGWVTMTEDRGCVTVQPRHLGIESPTGVFAAGNECASPLAASTTTAGGRAWLRLPASPGGAYGRLTLRLAGEAATGLSCAPASGAVVPMGLPWLLGGLPGAGPAAIATWGRPSHDAVLRRETW